MLISESQVGMGSMVNVSKLNPSNSASANRKLNQRKNKVILPKIMFYN